MDFFFMLYDPLGHILNHQALQRTQMSYMPQILEKQMWILHNVWKTVP